MLTNTLSRVCVIVYQYKSHKQDDKLWLQVCCNCKMACQSIWSYLYLKIRLFTQGIKILIVPRHNTKWFEMLLIRVKHILIASQYLLADVFRFRKYSLSKKRRLSMWRKSSKRNEKIYRLKSCKNKLLSCI